MKLIFYDSDRHIGDGKYELRCLILKFKSLTLINHSKPVLILAFWSANLTLQLDNKDKK